MIAAIFPSPEVILAAAVIAAIAGLRLMLPFRRERRAALWLGGLLAVAAVILVAVKDRLGVRDDAATGLRLFSKLELFLLTVDWAVRTALAKFPVVTAAVTVLWLLLPSGPKRRTASWLLALLGGATLAYVGLVGPTLPASGVILATAVAATAASLWHLLPQVIEDPADRRFNHWLGLLLGAVALAGFVATSRHLGGLGEEAVFLIVSLVAVVSAAATIVSRSPVYAAVWFALSLAGVAGVLLVLGAQFLGVATIVVYAGAILVMFLFVLMLAQPAGLAPYDRVSNEPFLSALAGAVLLGVLLLSIGRLSAEPASCCKLPSKADALASATQAAKPEAKPIGNRGGPPAAATPATAGDPLAADHVARLGGELFGRHLVAVEAAGVLLLVALIGAIAVVSRGEAAHAPEATTAMGPAAGRSAAR